MRVYNYVSLVYIRLRPLIAVSWPTRHNILCIIIDYMLYILNIMYNQWYYVMIRS